MAELADAHGSGPCDSNVMRVQVPFSARYIETRNTLLKGFTSFLFFDKNKECEALFRALAECVALSTSPRGAIHRGKVDNAAHTNSISRREKL